ncbi:MAG: hypothetical protein AAGE52_07750 [Myxococcota bacterium]
MKRVSLSLLSLALACGGSESVDVEDLFARGSFEVGHVAVEITYPAADTGEDRTLQVYLWYPTEESEGRPARYAVGGVVNIPSNALAAPPVADGSFPVAVYSHGNAGEGLLAYPYGELMASHGWVVASPNHTGNTAIDALLGESDPFLRVALDRPRDIGAVLDALADGRLAEGRADASRAMVMGHSFGGYTAFGAAGVRLDVDAQLAACADSTTESCALLADDSFAAALREDISDPRIVAVIPQAPALVLGFEEAALASLDVPVMLMTGRLDQTTTQTESAEPSWLGLDGPDDLWVEMPDGAHFSFITICDDLDEETLLLFQSDAFEDGCGDGFLPTTQAVPAIAAYVLAFSRQHVLGETAWDEFLRGPAFRAGFEITLN